MSQNYMNFIFNATPNVAIDKLNFNIIIYKFTIGIFANYGFCF